MLKIYVTPEERTAIAAKAKSAGTTLSAFIRDSALRRRLRPIPAINREAFDRLSRIGGNLNQFVHHLNAGISIPAALHLPDLHQLAGLLLVVRMALLGKEETPTT